MNANDSGDPFTPGLVAVCTACESDTERKWRSKIERRKEKSKNVENREKVWNRNRRKEKSKEVFGCFCFVFVCVRLFHGPECSARPAPIWVVPKACLARSVLQQRQPKFKMNLLSPVRGLAPRSPSSARSVPGKSLTRKIFAPNLSPNDLTHTHAEQNAFRLELDRFASKPLLFRL